MHFFQGLYDATENFELYSSQEKDLAVEVEDEEELEAIVSRNDMAKEEFFKVFGSIILGDNIKKVSEDQDIMLR